jgi:heterotetrameric sarcosine oxidase gamma subunit
LPDTAKVTSIEHCAIVQVKFWSPVGAEDTPRASIPESLVPSGLGGLVRVLDLGPREWLLVSDQVNGPELEERVVKQHTVGAGLAAVNLSCALKVIRVEGSISRELLSKGCGLDLHSEAFPAGRSTRTRFAQLSVIVDCIDPEPRFDLYLGRSYFPYLRSWLTDAAAEFSDVATR